ncbi:MAG: restriction endonuclease subunit S [Bacteroidales bacterium]|nr:restriction endonuclease subunit S [Bacteroidales bacterium]
MEWKEYSLGDVCSRLSSGKNIKASEVHNDGLYPVFGGNGIRGFTDKQNFNGECAVIGRQGAYCGNVRYFNGVAYMTEHALVLQGNEKSETQFLAYLLSIMDLGRLSGQSAQPGLSVKTLKIQKVSLPNLSDQRKIAGILSALDSKIENNNKINANLEAQAEALFKSWFVDFTPFKDQPFVDSELGPIPQGWKVGKLGDIGEIVGGSTPSKSKPEYYTTHGIAWLTPKDLSTSKAKFTSRGEIDITDEGYNSTSTKLMPRGSVLFSSRAPIGYLTIAKNEICTNQGFKSLVPNGAGTGFIYYTLRHLTPQIENRATGSTFKEASATLMRSVETIVPPTSILNKFEELLRPILQFQEKKEEENQRLAALRDTLLPKLMSGEIKL